MTNECLPYDNLQAIMATLEELNAYKDVDTILDKLLLEARYIANADAGSIFLVDRGNLKFSYVQNDSLFTNGLGQAEQYTNLKVPIDESSIVGYVALTGQSVAVADAYDIPGDLPYTFNASFDRKFGYKTRSILAIPLKTIDTTRVGVMQLINALDETGQAVPFSEFCHISIPLFANNASLAIEKGIMNRELILRMMRMTELRDPHETGAHVQRVGAYSAEIYQRIAQKRKVPELEAKRNKDLIRLASMLHDIGKIGIEDSILKKPGKLTPEEFEIMKWHPVHGALLFEHTTSQLDAMSRDISLYHHERWDGTGYPGEIEIHGGIPHRTGRTWKGNKIPLPARITALADVYDALCSVRCYKDAWPRENVLDHIAAQSGRHFDPEVVEAFMDIQDVIQAIGSLYEEK